MKYKRIFLPLGQQRDGNLIIPVDDNGTEKTDKEISKHLDNGWRIISTSSISSNLCTTGIQVFLVKE